jgi:tetratricopeptide (TPR) repeat protein
MQSIAGRLVACWNHLAGRWAALLFLLVTTGCTQLQHPSVVGNNALPRQIELADTPFFAQTLHHCGPASLAMLLSAEGVTASPEELAKLTYLPGRAGSLGTELLATPRQYQLLGYPVKPHLEALLAEVAAGRPALVLQNLGLSWLPRWHFAVLIGYDLDAREVVLRSGTTRRLTMSLNTFERTWLRGQRWAMLALSPDEAPAVAREVDYLKAALGLEQVGHLSAAEQAYERATRLWPESTSAWMALGNNRYSRGDRTAAAEAFRQAIVVDARFAPAYNNLAQVLAETGALEEAETLIQQALLYDTQHNALYQQTFQEIQERKAALDLQ